jgi:hydrogenase maturation protease
VRKVLVAGIGNVFLGDDGFGVEVIASLATRTLPDGTELGDFGIRGLDLAYSLMDGYDAAILVDALPRGEPPGTVTVIEPDLTQLDGFGQVESHAMDPVQVLRLVKQMGGTPPSPLFLVGCEPAEFGPEEGRMGLSDAVSRAVETAADKVEQLLQELTAGMEVS